MALQVHVCSSPHTNHLTLQPSSCFPCDHSPDWRHCWSCCHRGFLSWWSLLLPLSCSPHHCDRPSTPAWDGARSTKGEDRTCLLLSDRPHSPCLGTAPTVAHFLVAPDSKHYLCHGYHREKVSSASFSVSLSSSLILFPME